MPRRCDFKNINLNVDNQTIKSFSSNDLLRTNLDNKQRPSYIIFSKSHAITVWKVFVFGVFLVRVFPHSHWIRRDTPHLSVFSPNAGKYGSEKLRIRTFFTQCICVIITNILLRVIQGRSLILKHFLLNYK